MKEDPEKTNSYSRVAAYGMAWSTFSMMVAKLAGIASQFALGWLLSKEDFGIYALAISVASLVAILKNGGVYKILVQRGEDFNNLAPGLTKIALMFNLAALVTLLISAPFLASLYNEPKLKLLLAIIAISIPLDTLAMVLRAQLSVNFQFGALGRINAVSSLLKHSAMIVFALLGFGAVSFVLPLIVSALFETVAYYFAARPWSLGSGKALETFKTVSSDVRWIIVGALLLALNLQGEYLVIGLFESTALLGTYFFAFQLTISLGVLFVSGVDSVMLPSLARLSSETDRQRQAYMKAQRVLAYVSFPLIVATLLVLDPLITFLWAGRWDAAILASQLLMISMATRLSFSLSLVFLEAQGKWKSKTVFLGLDSAGIMLAAAFGAWLGELTSIVICTSTYRFISGLWYNLKIALLSDVKAWITLSAMFSASIAPIISGILAIVFMQFLGATANPLIEACMLTALFLTFFLTLSAVFFREQWVDIFSLISNR